MVAALTDKKKIKKVYIVQAYEILLRKTKTIGKKLILDKGWQRKMFGDCSSQRSH